MTRDVVALLLVFRFVFLLCSARNSAVQKGTSTSGTSVTARKAVTEVPGVDVPFCSEPEFRRFWSFLVRYCT